MHTAALAVGDIVSDETHDNPDDTDEFNLMACPQLQDSATARFTLPVDGMELRFDTLPAPVDNIPDDENSI